MNKHKFLTVLVYAIGLHAGVLWAGNNLIELTDDSGVVGATLTTNMLWTNGNNALAVQFDIEFNNAVFSFDSCAISAPYNANPYFSSCTLVGGGTAVRFLTVRTDAGVIDSGTFGTVDFTALGPPGIYQMTVEDVVVDLGVTDTDPAIMEILGASYNSTPFAPGAPIPFGSHTAGDTNPVEALTIDNDGEVGTTLTGMCSLGGANPAAFGISGDVNFSVPEAGPNDQVDIACNSSTLAPGSYNAILSCAHDGDSNPASPVTYALSCTINAAPSPEYASSPFNPGDKIDFGTHTTNDPAQDIVLTIENVGNADGLAGSCSITSNPNNAYSVDVTAYNLNQAQQAMRTVTCDTSVVGDHNGGVLSCTHNGTAIPSPAMYDLNCEVTPTPAYSQTPAAPGPIDFGTIPQNNTPPPTALQINNLGEAGSTLMGTCSFMDGTVLQLSGSGDYSDAVGGGSAMVGLTCDTSQPQGFYSDTLSCTHNDPELASPVDTTVECTIGPPDPAMYDSTPPPSSVIDMTPGDAVPVGTDLTDAAQLAIRNAADTGDDFLQLEDCQLTGPDPEITANPPVSNAQIDPDDPDTIILFSCNTSAAGSFSNTYSCPYDENPSVVPTGRGKPNPATYEVVCEVREAESDVEESPPSGTPQTAEVGPGESHTFSFLFNEVLDEGEDATLEGCQLASGGEFAITSPASFPQPIPAGGSIQVDVQFTDPGVGDTFNDTLTCQWTDSDSDPGEASWPLEVTVTGRNATFRVTKDFSDDNPMDVTVSIECNTGLPLQQQAEISEFGNPFDFVEFVVVDFEPGTMDCDIEEVVPAGYEASYFADFGDNGIAGGVFADEFGCHYEDVESANFICEITNELQPVDVVVEKQWIDEHPEFQLPTTVEVTLRCEDPIIGGFNCIGGRGNGDFCSQRFIDPNNPGEFQVLPHFDGTECSATEELIDGVLTDDSDCDSMIVFPGQGESCVIVNTRLFAGIPTLSQYGLLLMALLMLGVGLIGFRRYA